MKSKGLEKRRLSVLAAILGIKLRKLGLHSWSA